ncbi:hypothetical protein, partial [Microcoleus sp. CZ3-B4]
MGHGAWGGAKRSGGMGHWPAQGIGPSEAEGWGIGPRRALGYPRFFDNRYISTIAQKSSPPLP